MTPQTLRLFSTWQWTTIVGGLVVTGVSMTSFAFNTFEAKNDVKELAERIDKRLDRIEKKIDRFIERKE